MMKKILSLIAAVLFAQAAFAQVCAFQVDGEKITFDGKEVDLHEAGAVLQKAQTDFQDIFVYVTYDTPLGFVNDLKAILEGNSTSGVVFVNPVSSADFPRLYGPVIAYHKIFIELEMLRKGHVATFQNTNEDAWNFTLEGAAPEDYAYNSSRMQNYLRTAKISDNAKTDWTNNFDGVVLNLAYQTPIGVLYSFDQFLNNESVPYMNVVYHTEGTPLCPESWFTVVHTGLEEYKFPTIQPIQPVQYNGKDLETFSKTCQAYASITALDGKEALPGLDKVIIDHLYSLPGYWTPQFVKGQPVNVKVVCPVYGEISQW